MSPRPSPLLSITVACGVAGYASLASAAPTARGGSVPPPTWAAALRVECKATPATAQVIASEGCYPVSNAHVGYLELHPDYSAEVFDQRGCRGRVQPIAASRTLCHRAYPASTTDLSRNVRSIRVTRRAAVAAPARLARQFLDPDYQPEPSLAAFRALRCVSRFEGGLDCVYRTDDDQGGRLEAAEWTRGGGWRSFATPHPLSAGGIACVVRDGIRTECVIGAPSASSNMQHAVRAVVQDQRETRAWSVVEIPGTGGLQAPACAATRDRRVECITTDAGGNLVELTSDLAPAVEYDRAPAATWSRTTLFAGLAVSQRHCWGADGALRCVGLVGGLATEITSAAIRPLGNTPLTSLHCSETRDGSRGGCVGATEEAAPTLVFATRTGADWSAFQEIPATGTKVSHPECVPLPDGGWLCQAVDSTARRSHSVRRRPDGTWGTWFEHDGPTGDAQLLSDGEVVQTLRSWNASPDVAVLSRPTPTSGPYDHLALDEYAMVATHNSTSLLGVHLVANQGMPVGDQLAHGVRQLNLDLYWQSTTHRFGPGMIGRPGIDDGRIASCHESDDQMLGTDSWCPGGAIPFRDTLRDIVQFLRENPDEIVVLKINDYVLTARERTRCDSPQGCRHARRIADQLWADVVADDAADLLLDMRPYQGYAHHITLGEMKARGQRLAMFGAVSNLNFESAQAPATAPAPHYFYSDRGPLQDRPAECSNPYQNSADLPVRAPDSWSGGACTGAATLHDHGWNLSVGYGHVALVIVPIAAAVAATATWAVGGPASVIGGAFAGAIAGAVLSAPVAVLAADQGWFQRNDQATVERRVREFEDVFGVPPTRIEVDWFRAEDTALVGAVEDLNQARRCGQIRPPRARFGCERAEVFEETDAGAQPAPLRRATETLLPGDSPHGSLADLDQQRLLSWMENECDMVVGGRAASYQEYRQCLADRGLRFVPHPAWRLEVEAHCRNAVGPDLLAGFPTYARCMQDRQVAYELPESWPTLVGTYCDRAVIGGRFVSYREYQQCLRDRDVDPVTDPAWRDGSRAYCDRAVIGGGTVSYNEYWRCLADRGVDFINDDAWKRGVIAHCSGAVAASRAASYNEYWRCLADRKVAFVGDAAWRREVVAHCSGAVFGGRVQSYREYWACLAHRRVSFVADASWHEQARRYCAGAVVGGPAVSYNEYRRCLTDRKSSFDRRWWCGTAVRNHCEAQWYPFGGKDRCYRDRWCS